MCPVPILLDSWYCAQLGRPFWSKPIPAGYQCTLVDNLAQLCCPASAPSAALRMVLLVEFWFYDTPVMCTGKDVHMHVCSSFTPSQIHTQGGSLEHGYARGQMHRLLSLVPCREDARFARNSMQYILFHVLSNNHTAQCSEVLCYAEVMLKFALQENRGTVASTLHYFQ